QKQALTAGQLHRSKRVEYRTATALGIEADLDPIEAPFKRRRPCGNVSGNLSATSIDQQHRASAGDAGVDLLLDGMGQTRDSCRLVAANEVPLAIVKTATEVLFEEDVGLVKDEQQDGKADQQAESEDHQRHPHRRREWNHAPGTIGQACSLNM